MSQECEHFILCPKMQSDIQHIQSDIEHIDKDMEAIKKSDTLQELSLKSLHKRMDGFTCTLKDMRDEYTSHTNLIAKGLEETVGTLGALRQEFISHTKEEMTRISLATWSVAIIASSLAGFGVWLVNENRNTVVALEKHAVMLEQITKTLDKVVDKMDNQNAINVEMFKAMEGVNK